MGIRKWYRGFKHPRYENLNFQAQRQIRAALSENSIKRVNQWSQESFRIAKKAKAERVRKHYFQRAFTLKSIADQKRRNR